MESMSLLVAVGIVLGAVLAVLNIREKLWPKPPMPHPLDAALRDIATAIRETHRL